MKTLSVAAFALCGLCALRGASPGPQELHHAAGVINVEVPVRVFDGDRFVGDLALQDFEVLEDGRPQKIAALYLIRKGDVQKEEKPAPSAETPAPKTGRTIVLQFQITEPDPKLEEAVNFFFDQVLQPEDSLTVITPRATYRFDPEALGRLPRRDVARRLNDKLRKDILAGAADYRRLLSDIRDIERTPLDPDEKLQMLSEVYRQLRDRAEISKPALARMAKALKAQEGQKFVFLFYEKELVKSASFGNFGDETLPAEERVLDDMAATELRRIPSVNTKEIERIFSDASITVHFIYLTQSKMNAAGLGVEELRRDQGRATRDLSPSLFTSFREMAEATGGVSEASANPFAAFKKAATATENYYLLYYVPDDYRADGRFKEIEVTVKDKRFRVAHRAGYFAN